jgi:hypothetical protein
MLYNTDIDSIIKSPICTLGLKLMQFCPCNPDHDFTAFQFNSAGYNLQTAVHVFRLSRNILVVTLQLKYSKI